MKNIVTKVIIILSTLRLAPIGLFILLAANEKKSLIKKDLDRWASIYSFQVRGKGGVCAFILLMTRFKEYRTLVYSRLGFITRTVWFLCPPLDSLYLPMCSPDIGPGLFIQHGFSTIISAKTIGSNCWINQQVTIGYSNETDCPSIGNNVTIYAGAKVIGNVTIGDNSIVGANAVVVSDVPPNCTVVGVPAYIVKQNGLRVSGKER